MTRAPLYLLAAVILSTSLITLSAFADTGCRRDCEAPTLGVTYEGKRMVDNGFTLDGKPFDVEELTQTLPTTKVRTGDVVKIRLVVFENSGAEFLQGTSLSIGNYVDDNHVNTMATISYKSVFNAVLKQSLSQDSDVSKTFTVDDPSGMLKGVDVKTSEIDSYRTAIDMSFIVKKPIPTSDIFVQTLDAKKNTKTNVFRDAITVTGNPIIEKAPQPTKNVPAPIKQMKKSPSAKIECRDGFELVIRANGMPSCVSTYTAELLKERGMATSG